MAPPVIAVVDHLLVINQHSIKAGRNRTIEPEFFVSVADPQKWCVIGTTLVHNEMEMRCQVLFPVMHSDDPVELWLDMSFEDWDAVKGMSAKILPLLVEAIE